MCHSEEADELTIHALIKVLVFGPWAREEVWRCAEGWWGGGEVEGGRKEDVERAGGWKRGRLCICECNVDLWFFPKQCGNSGMKRTRTNRLKHPPLPTLHCDNYCISTADVRKVGKGVVVAVGGHVSFLKSWTFFPVWVFFFFLSSFLFMLYKHR